jgi:ferredoxin, 2Fe-2S
MMPTIVYVEPDGKRVSIEVDTGANVMRTAVANNVTGIVAECGGAAMCATCHVYVEADQLPPMGEVEHEMLESAAAARSETSRLSCQLTMPEGLEILLVRIPDKQA